MKINIDTKQKYLATGVVIPNETGTGAVMHKSPHRILSGNEVIDLMLAAEEHIELMQGALRNLHLLAPTKKKDGDKI